MPAPDRSITNAPIEPEARPLKPEVLQIAPMLPHVEAALGDAYVVHRYWEAPDRPKLLAEVGPRVRAVATDGHYGIAPEIMAALPGLELVASYGVGYDAIDTAACKARGVRVTNTPGVLNDAVAELTLGLILALCRRIPQADAYVREGRWLHGNFGLTGELTGAHAGILGLGRIGKEIARRLQAMRMRVSYHGRQRAGLRALRLLSRPRGDGARRRLAGGGRARLGRDPRDRVARGAGGARARRARWSTSRAARWSTRPRWSSSSPTAGSAAPRSTSSPTSRACPRRCLRCPTSSCRRTRARPPRRPAPPWAIWWSRNLAAHFAGDPLLTPVA